MGSDRNADSNIWTTADSPYDISFAVHKQKKNQRKFFTSWHEVYAWLLFGNVCDTLTCFGYFFAQCEGWVRCKTVYSIYSVKSCHKVTSIAQLRDDVAFWKLSSNCSPLGFPLSSWYGSYWCRRWRRHKVWISDNMGGKSSVTFYCSLHRRVMVLLNCAELNREILWSH